MIDLSESSLESAKEKLVAAGIPTANVITVACNVAAVDSCKAAFDQIFEAFGRIDVLVQSAGIVGKL